MSITGGDVDGGDGGGGPFTRVTFGYLTINKNDSPDKIGNVILTPMVVCYLEIYFVTK